MAGRTIRLGPPVVDAVDILEYALAAIEQHGWRQGLRPEEPKDDTRSSWEKSVVPHGLSLHDAIGYACVVLSGESGQAATPPRASRSSKEFQATTPSGYGMSLRSKATDLVNAVLPAGESDLSFNDKAADASAVTAVLRSAIQKGKKQ